MSDPRAIPEEERPVIPEELVPHQQGGVPVRANAEPDSEDEEEDDPDDGTIEVEDLP